MSEMTVGMIHRNRQERRAANRRAVGLIAGESRRLRRAEVNLAMNDEVWGFPPEATTDYSSPSAASVFQP